MKKFNNYSTQYKIISHSLATTNAPTLATANAQNFTRDSFHNPTEQLHNQNQNHGKTTTNLRKLSRNLSHKKTLSKDRQEFINNISASGFKQFNL